MSSKVPESDPLGISAALFRVLIFAVRIHAAASSLGPRERRKFSIPRAAAAVRSNYLLGDTDIPHHSQHLAIRLGASMYM